jgi:hypothetical protein
LEFVEGMDERKRCVLRKTLINFRGVIFMAPLKFARNTSYIMGGIKL